MRCATCGAPVKSWRELAEHAEQAHGDTGPRERLEALEKAKEEKAP